MSNKREEFNNLSEEILFNSTKKNELYMSTALSLEGIKLTEQSQSQSITPLAQHYQIIYKTEWHLPEVWFGGDVCQFVMLAHTETLWLWNSSTACP